MKKLTGFISAALIAVTSFGSAAVVPSQVTCLYPPAEFQKALSRWIKAGWGIRNFDAWLFEDGALFGVQTIWWKTKHHYHRQYPHEGVDFYFYKAKQNNVLEHVQSGQLIPLIMGGKLISVFSDFIGKSLLFATDIVQNHKRFYILYAHVKPTIDTSTALGKTFVIGDKIFAINIPEKNDAPPHLHVTILWTDEDFSPGAKLDWDILDTHQDIELINPLLNNSELEHAEH